MGGREGAVVFGRARTDARFDRFTPEGETLSFRLFRTNWEFPKIRGTLFWGSYNKDPIV